MKKLGAVLVIALVLVSCDSPTSNGNAPILTAIRIVAYFTDISQLQTSPPITTLSAGKQYALLFFTSDEDLDITKIVVDKIKDGRLVATDELPVLTAQATATATFMSIITATETGVWKLETYLEDSRGNKSNKKSITVTVI